MCFLLIGLFKKKHHKIGLGTSFNLKFSEKLSFQLKITCAKFQVKTMTTSKVVAFFRLQILPENGNLALGGFDIWPIT